jgi:hypothetical protein
VVLQLPINGAALGLLLATDGLTAADLRATGGLAGSTVLIAAAAQGWQALGIRLANRGRGYKHRNVLVALIANAALLATIPLSSGVAAASFVGLLVLGLALAAADGLLGLLSDIRSLARPHGGIGIFCGTFNPMHRTHVEMIARAIRERGLERVLVHPTVVPKLHAQALARGEIEIVDHREGMRVYGRTAKADENVDYFPTGSRFYEHPTRELLIQLSLRDTGIGDRVEVLSWESVYREHGFYGVIAEIRRRYPGQRLHGLHGSDPGGMWNRAIYDESGWIYPFSVRRTDAVSGTAIRAGAVGMMTPTGEAIVAQLREGSSAFSAGGRHFVVREGVVSVDPG